MTTTAPCQCPRYVRPVCGTDGQTYQNACQLECASAAAGNEGLAVDHDGKCEQSSTAAPCNCLGAIREVCGTDGNTYPNPCMLECAAREQGIRIRVDHDGECQETTTVAPCTCPRSIRKVCGTDGNTYQNQCLLECSAREQGEKIYIAAIVLTKPCHGAPFPILAIYASNSS
ncbi:PREDICTED: serine protease inhibitor dipetalogastin-like [Priapulus caudatus]|uniref:Serine protease inhibitor dipetalogastin-like n=1 Tax=Priapulus caudatus TaxID=37621 RepID=A0ABM1EZC3_PRICU|nr:PREDICTED: serine protease inhibitor dipetalogastin-like [Priapulus caudatus]